jgi:hypothetical protein|tara:strand:- start:250 stop:474 length:225 start_codon:yes stop_codon:yes gene_type:complete
MYMEDKYMCETLGCRTIDQIEYLGALLCLKCKNQIQDFKFEGGKKTLAVTTFEKKHNYAFLNGHIPGYNREENE